ncbi:MAG: isochorismate synthase [Candidatus Margulisiibacteriota bacterium]
MASLPLQTLAQQIDAALSRPLTKPLRIAVELEHSIDPLAWIAHQPFSQKMAWQNQAGVGSAKDWPFDAEPETFAWLEACFNNPNLADISVYGGVAFPTATLADAWQVFGRSRWFVPQIELKTENTTTTLACTLWPGQTPETIHAVLDQLVWNTPTLLPKLALESPQFCPDFDTFQTLFNGVSKGFVDSIFQKLVLARTCRATFKHTNPYSLLSAFQTPALVPFGFTFGNTTFLGATPERFLVANGDQVETPALAGTVPRGSNPIEDASLEAMLTHSPKLDQEHRIVAQDIEKVFAKYTTFTQTDTLLKLTKLQHRLTRFSGTRHGALTDMLTDLYPTSAVGGTPTSAALNWLAENEPFDRGWYSGLVGQVSFQKLDLAVALRSALFEGNRCQLYSGIGLVPGSNVDSEWQELNLKLAPFLDLN